MARTITLKELRARMDAGDAPVLIEALPEEYFRQGHLPGALHLPHDEVTKRAASVVPDKEASLVVYCASASCRNSHAAAASFEALGYRDVAVYAGGKKDWEEAGLPLER
ncbi:MAG: rhodanese-like domain-containing protein [Methyloligellaceae bacterium]